MTKTPDLESAEFVPHLLALEGESVGRMRLRLVLVQD